MDSINGDFSRIVKAIRFPLTIMVVLWHTRLLATFTPSLPVYAQGVSIFMYYLFSCTLTYAAVPTFFFVSGFFFFKGLESWNWIKYSENLKKRVWSLLIPFLLWILIYLLIRVILPLLLRNPVNEWGGVIINYLDEHGWLKIFWNNNRIGENPKKLYNIIGVPMHHMYPLMTSMWYLRDLMMVCLLSPLLYLSIRYCGKVGLIMMGFLMCLNIWIPFEGFSAWAFFFFMCGGYMRVASLNVLDSFRRLEFLSYFIAIIAVFFRLFFYSSNYVLSTIFVNVYSIFGMISIFNIARRLVHKKESKLQEVLSESTFFIYCFHLVIMGYVVLFVNKMLTGDGELIVLSKYILVPTITLVSSLLVYLVMKTVFPRLFLLLNGGR